MHVLPQLRKLERKYDRRLAVIGVHSPKFTSEQETESLNAAIRRLNVGHPVINDRDFRVWQEYAVRAWPTLMFVDPQGKVIGKHEGEISYEVADRLIGEMLTEFEAAGLIDTRPIPGAYGDHNAHDPRTPLRFPGKVLADAASGRLFVSDTGHNRIVMADLAWRVRTAIGRGQAGLVDGPPDRAAFNQPQGLALTGNTLYVADTENHAVRAINLTTGAVRTLAGTGEQGTGPRTGGTGRETLLNSPWDLSLLHGTLYIALAGDHQVWSLAIGGLLVQPMLATARKPYATDRWPTQR